MDGCLNKHFCKGYCSKHFSKFKKYGDPLFVMIRNPPKEVPEIDRFMKYVKKEAACWEWTGSLMGGYKTDKYGQFSSMGKPTYAHRWSYTYFNGEIPKGKQIHHKCHNTKCVNPSHLEAVTQIENGLKHGKTNPPYLNSIKTHCKHGHPFSGDNLQIYTSQRNRPARRCVQCAKNSTLKQKQKKNDKRNMV